MKREPIRILIALSALVAAIVIGIVGVAPRRVLAEDSGPACDCVDFQNKDGIKIAYGCMAWDCRQIAE